MTTMRIEDDVVEMTNESLDLGGEGMEATAL